MEIVVLRKEHLEGFTPSLLDILEAEACGFSWQQAMGEMGDAPLGVMHEGALLTIGGDTRGCCWFITSELIYCLGLTEKAMFIQLMKMHVEALLKRWPKLWNYVWSGNELHKKFLKKLGATFTGAGYISVSGERFDYFEIT